MGRAMRAAQGPRPARKATKAAKLVVVPYTTNDIPAPERACDGGWLGPAWWPDTGWTLMALADDTPTTMVSRAQCGDPECGKLHVEEYEQYLAEQARRKARRLAYRRKARHAAQAARQ